MLKVRIYIYKAKPFVEKNNFFRLHGDGKLSVLQSWNKKVKMYKVFY